MKIRIKFRKYGVMKFIGHLDIMRYFQKSMRRAEIPIAFSKGYSPHMIMSFANPLGVGLTSDGEYLDIELVDTITSEEAVARLNKVMVEGIEVLSFREVPEKQKASMALVTAARYLAQIQITDQEQMSEIIDKYLSQSEILITKKTKKSEREINLKPFIYEMFSTNGGIELLLASGSVDNIKPELVINNFFEFMKIPLKEHPVTYHRIDVYGVNESEEGFLTLEDLAGDR